MADEGNNSDINPKNDTVPTTGNTFGYPGARGSGAPVTQIEPTTRNNGKIHEHK